MFSIKLFLGFKNAQIKWNCDSTFAVLLPRKGYIINFCFSIPPRTVILKFANSANARNLILMR